MKHFAFKTAKKAAKIASLVIALTTSTITTAQPWGFFGCPYLGADVAGRHFNWSEQGGDIFKKDYLQGNLYAGLSFCEFLGIEGGYEATIPRTSYNNLTTNGIFLGRTTTLIGPLSTQGTFQISGWHASLVGFLPIIVPQTNLYMSVGVAYLRTIAWATILGDAVGALTPATNLFRASARKTVLRVGGGAEYFFDPCFGLRLSVNWENTNRFKNIRNEYNSFDTSSRISLRDSWIYGVGVFTKF